MGVRTSDYNTFPFLEVSKMLLISKKGWGKFRVCILDLIEQKQ